MLKKYNQFLNEEVGIRNITKLIADHKAESGSNHFEIWFHQDLDGVTSALAMKNYLERYKLKMVDSHITQYGGMEYAIKQKRPDSMAVLVDFAHFKTMFTIATDHHTGQTGEPSGSSYAKPSRSNVETISDEISPSDIFMKSDIDLIKTVDSADFLKYDIKPEDIQNMIFSVNKNLSGEKNRFMMGFVVNRLLLVFKNKRISVVSLDGKREHNNKNFLECLVMDSTPSLVSMFLNIKHYMENAISLEYDKPSRKHNVPKKLSSVEDLRANLDKYIGSRVNAKDLEYDDDYKIVKQYGIGYVMDPGSYDRYVVFKNNPEADFVCTIFPMGLIQVSCNPFKEKKLAKVDLGAITQEMLAKYQDKLKRFYVPISDIKRISEDDVAKMKTKYGEAYQPIGFTFGDLKSFYPKSIMWLPNRKSGDMKTTAVLDLNNEEDPQGGQVVKIVRDCMDKPFSEWTDRDRTMMGLLKIPVFDIITVNSGGHPSITNIQGLNYLSSRYDLLKGYFGTDKYTDVMKLFADEFLTILKAKIDAIRNGQEVEYQTGDVKLSADVANENFEYFLKDKTGDVKPVSKDQFIKAGFDSKFEPKKSEGGKGFSMNIDSNKIIGNFE